MSRWDILLDRTNQAKIKTDYVNEVNKENEKKYWKERCDKAQDKFFDMIKAEELKEIFDLYEALGGPRFYWEHELGRHPYEVNPQWKDVCPDSRWAGGPDYTEDRDLDRIGIGTRHGSGRIAYIPCLRMRFDDPDWGINWNYLSVEIYLNKDNHIILHQDGYSYSDRHSVDVFNAMDENKRTAIIYELYKENEDEPYVYSGRYDIGSENGDIIDTISHYLDWKIEHENDQNALLFKNDFIPEAGAGRKLSVEEAKRVDNIFDEMLKRELKYKTINFTREHFETVDTARDVMRVEEKMDELYNNGDISGKTHDEVLNHLSEVEEALYERIKDNMENNFLFKTQVENAVNADGEFGYKRALYNQDDVYKDVVKDVLEIDDLQKDADEMEL